MKRALAIAVAVCTLGVAGFSQIAIKGSWTAEACLTYLDLVVRYPGATITLPSMTLTVTTQTVTVPAHTITLVIKGGTYTHTIPEQTLPVNYEEPPGQTASVTIPAYTVTITIPDQTVTYTIPAQTLTVTPGTVTVPAQTIVVPPWTQTFAGQPQIALTSSLSLTYTVAGFDITSITGFGPTGVTAQSFTLKGAFGPFSMDGGMRFVVSPPGYSRSWLTTGFDFGGVAISLLVRHWLPGQYDSAWTSDPCTGKYDAGMQYTFTTTIAPVSARIRFLDCCEGIEFQDLRLTLTGVDLCCGIKYNAVLDFTKAGFDKLTLSGINIPLCCGVSFDVSITYGIASKSVTVTPKFAGFAEACFTVWGGPTMDGMSWDGIRIDGYRILCKIADCNYLEYVHAFLPIQDTIPAAIRAKFLTACAENEYLELGFCGPGCCGGRYSATLRIMWSTTAQGGLFGVTRFVGVVAIPIMTNFTLNLNFVAPAAACASASFCLGWTFTF